MAIMYSIVVPCYNEEKNIENLVQEFVPVWRAMKEYGFELILVDNGSTDSTHKMIEKVSSQYDWIQLAYVLENQGYGYGILKGLECSQGEYLGWIHADLQVSPLTFLKMFSKLNTPEAANIFQKGRRHKRPLFNCAITFGMSCFETLYLGQGLWDINAQPTLMHRSLYDKAVNPPYDFSFDLYYYYMAKKNKYKVIRTDIRQRKRLYGESKSNTSMYVMFQWIKRTIEYSRIIKKKR